MFQNILDWEVLGMFYFIVKKHIEVLRNAIDWLVMYDGIQNLCGQVSLKSYHIRIAHFEN